MVETRTGTLTWNYCSEDSRHTRYGQVTISYVSYMLNVKHAMLDITLAHAGVPFRVCE